MKISLPSLDVSGILDNICLQGLLHAHFLMPYELGIVCYYQINIRVPFLETFRITSNCLLPRNLLKTLLVKGECYHRLIPLPSNRV